MTTGPGFDPPRPEQADPTREHPLGDHEPDAEPPTGIEHKKSGQKVRGRTGSSGQRPYGGRPHPDQDREHLPGEWHDEGLTGE